MGQYFEAVQPYTGFHSKLYSNFYVSKHAVAEAFDIEGWREKRAIELLLNMSAVAHIGLMSALGEDKDELKRIIEFQKNIRKGASKRVKNIIDLIEARQLSINTMFPRELLPEDVNAEITLLGMFGLGLLRTVYPDQAGEGQIRIFTISLLIRKDPFAALIRETFPEHFNGFETVREFLLEEKLNKLPPKQMTTAYQMLNL